MGRISLDYSYFVITIVCNEILGYPGNGPNVKTFPALPGMHSRYPRRGTGDPKYRKTRVPGNRFPEKTSCWLGVHVPGYRDHSMRTVSGYLLSITVYRTWVLKNPSSSRFKPEQLICTGFRTKRDRRSEWSKIAPTWVPGYRVPCTGYWVQKVFVKTLRASLYKKLNLQT